MESSSPASTASSPVESCTASSMPSRQLSSSQKLAAELALSDPDDVVIHRAKFLQENGFGCYNVFKNNCEDFAIYFKMGLLVVDQTTMRQSGQAVSIIGGPLAAVLSTLRLLTTNVYGMAATAVSVYCVSRYAADIGMRKDVVKVVEPRIVASAAPLLESSQRRQITSS